MSTERKEIVGLIQEVPSPARLWASDDTALWFAVLVRYPAAVAAAATRGKSKAALPELDRWYRMELPAALATTGTATASASPAAATRHGSPEAGNPERGWQEEHSPHITQAQLEKLVEWKMARGQWRPRLLSFAREQPAGAVEATSKKALGALRGYRPPASGSGSEAPAAGVGPSDLALRAAVEALTALKGVGPATASALLAAANPDVPFMGDEAMSACLPPGRQSDYSLKAFLELALLLQAKARRLQHGSKETPPSSEYAPGPLKRMKARSHSPAGEAEAAAGPGNMSASGSAGEAANSGRTSPPSTSHMAPAPDLAAGNPDWSAADVERCLWVAAVLHASGGGGTVGASVGGGNRAKGDGIEVVGVAEAGGKVGRGAKRTKR